MLTRPAEDEQPSDHLRVRVQIGGGPAEETATRLPKVPARGQYTESARLERLDWARAQTGAPLLPLQTTRLDPARLSGNVESLIGAVEIPVGLAGPLLFRGQEAEGIIYAPYATSEGALVASASRGATALSRSGGVATRVTRQRMMRVPVFVLSSMSAAFRFSEWVQGCMAELREQTRAVSRRAELTSVEPVIIGRMVHLYLSYETGDAAGQNMTTACTWRICQWIMEQIATLEGVEVEHFIVEANMSGDKKVSPQTFLTGRGMRVVSECLLSRAVLEQVLKVTPEHLLRCNAAMMAGSAQIGMAGYNINVANTVAAIFTATGQDIACVHESSLGHLHLEPVEDGVYASLTLPGLIVGTVGGGTHLPAQHALLEMMGCTGAGTARRLAEIITGYALALDLSTLAALATGEFASAHERLGRNRPVSHLTREALGPGFFQPALRDSLADPALEVDAVEDVHCVLGSSILTELTARRSHGKLVGLLPLRLRHSGGPGRTETELLLKAKPLDEEVVLMLDSMAAMCGPRVAAAHHRFRRRTGFSGCHLRELALYGQTDPRFRRHAPEVYGVVRDDAREAYVLLLERLRGLRHMDSADDVSAWTAADREAAIRGIAEVHAIWLGREEELRTQPWLGEPMSAGAMVEMTELWEALVEHAAQEFPELIGEAERELHLSLVRALPGWWPRIEELPRTLIHNDFNPRNLALREGPEGLRLCAYDWELATLHLPQHDLAEFLAFTLSPGATRDQVDPLLEVHRQALERAGGVALDPALWREGYALSLRDLAVNRFALYLMAHTFRHYAFMERTLRTLWRLLEIEGVRP